MQAKLPAPRERGIILVDVVGYSRYDALGQAAILALLQQAIDDARFAQGLFAGAATVIEQIVTTGDGCYFVFHEHLNEKFARAALAIMAGFYCAQMRHRKEFDLPVGTQHTVQVTRPPPPLGHGRVVTPSPVRCPDASLAGRLPQRRNADLTLTIRAVASILDAC